ncbi:MFS transporter [Bacillus sp. BP-3]|uniref:MFS transporter n=1 Tax=Bacillus sp. BP-3 TaxID=3022773 RepID=UPI00232CE400|nr:MFS transporter [Bacillus sp. BP-3]MDC2863151.1 MFS transporter [Bacillus sp. BP-3]
MSNVVEVKNGLTKQNYSLMTIILFWCGLVVVSSLYVTIPLVSIFASEFKVTIAKATLTSSAFSFFYAVGFLFFGPLSDRYGRKLIILLGLIVLAFVSPLLAFFNNLSSLIILRSIQGVAAATFAPSALAYVVEVFPLQKRVTTIGFVSTGFLMAGIVGQVFSSFMATEFGWQSVFYCLAGMYLITAILVIIFLPSNGVNPGNGNLLNVFKQIIVVLRNKQLLMCYVITLTLLLTFVGMYTTLGSYLGINFHLTNQQILSIRSVGIIGMLLSPFAGKLVGEFGVNHILRSGIVMAILGLAVLGVCTNLSLLIVMSIIFVGGISLTVPTLIVMVGQFGGEYRGIAVSLYTFILFIGATLGPIIAITLLGIGSYVITFETLAFFLVISLVISFSIKRF